MKTIRYKVHECAQTKSVAEVAVTEEHVRAYVNKQLKYISESDTLSDLTKTYLRGHYHELLEEFITDPTHKIWEETAMERFDELTPACIEEEETLVTDISVVEIGRSDWE